MVGRLRIARLDPAPYTPVAEAGPPDAEAHHRLRSAIRRHLPAVTASLLAEPAPATGSREIGWYTDLAGQPMPLAQLPEPERSKARQLLHDRLRALARLAERLPSLEPDGSLLAEQLRQALSFPGEETVFVVDGQPVVTFWAYRASDGTVARVPGVTAPAVPESTPVDEPPAAAPARRMGRWGWPLLASLLVAALLVLLARWQGWGLRWPPWGPDYPALLAAAQADEASAREHLATLEDELRARLEVCRLRAALEQARNDEARLLGRLDALHDHLRDALAECPARTALAETQADARALQARLDGLRSQLAARLKDCQQATPQPAAAPVQARTPPPPAPKPGEALRIPTAACQSDTIDFFDGRWESISDIANSRTNEPVVLHYQIKSGRGRVAIVEGMGQPRQTCAGGVRAALRDCQLIIEQPRIACPDGSVWAPTRTVCTPDATGKAACTLHQKGPPPEVAVQIIRLP